MPKDTYTHPQSESKLLTLPAEVRVEIYTLSLISAKPIIDPGIGTLIPKILAAALQINPTLRNLTTQDLSQNLQGNRHPTPISLERIQLHPLRRLHFVYELRQLPPTRTNRTRQANRSTSRCPTQKRNPRLPPQRRPQPRKPLHILLRLNSRLDPLPNLRQGTLASN